MPIETWPRGTGSLTLEQWQRDVNNTGGDRHSIIVQPATGGDLGNVAGAAGQQRWEASNGAKFNLNSNALRPAGWTSGDAAGLPMFPALVRLDECERGMVEHALRLVVKQTRDGIYLPGDALGGIGAGKLSESSRDGSAAALEGGFRHSGELDKQEKAVLLALKKYGALVADNGNFFSISVCPDDRFPSNCFQQSPTIDINNFEVVQTTGVNQGPRSPGAPTVNAGPDLEVLFPSSAALNGVVNEPSGAAAVLWYTYAGPGMATFADATNRQNGVTFSAPGSYTLMLRASDGVHAVAYDAVIVRVVLPTALNRTGNDVAVSFQTVLNQRYRVEQAGSFTATNWATVADNISGNGGTMSATDFNALSSGTRFYRILALP